MWKKGEKPDKKLSVYQHISSHGHTTDAIIVLTGGDLCPRGPGAGVSDEENKTERLPCLPTGG